MLLSVKPGFLPMAYSSHHKAFESSQEASTVDVQISSYILMEKVIGCSEMLLRKPALLKCKEVSVSVEWISLIISKTVI